MPQAVDNLASVVERLSERLLELETRIADLESTVLGGRHSPDNALPQSKRSDLPTSLAAADSKLRQPHPTPTRLSLPHLETGRAFSAIGKAALGFAGAFLLRALAETGSLPKLPILIVAIAYAYAWMIWSLLPVDRFASATYAFTSALILSPMLWEATVRFQSLPTSAGAISIVAFVVLPLGLASRHSLQLIPWIAVLAAVSTDIALIIATRELVPLTLALLAIAAVTEILACFAPPTTFRAIPAITADFSIWLAVYVLGSASVPEGYHPVPPTTLMLLCTLLPIIYGSSIGFRIFVRRSRITFFEVGQITLTFGLAFFGLMTASRNAAAPALGIFFLLLAAFCYWGTLRRFAADAHARNRRVSASWAAALLLAGTFLSLPDSFQIPFLCAAALLTAILYTRTAKMSLGLHASFYLACAAAVSCLTLYVWNSLAGTVPASPDWRARVVALAAGICYAIESSHEVDAGHRRLLWLIPSSIVAFTIAGCAIATTVRLAAGHFQLAASHVSMIRTIVICVLALALGVASRRRHIELRWIAYAAVALGALKLILEDLRFGNPASLVVSFLFYGLILIMLPRLTRNQADAASTVMPKP